jgi:hypothetical protein
MYQLFNILLTHGEQHRHRHDNLKRRISLKHKAPCTCALLRPLRCRWAVCSHQICGPCCSCCIAVAALAAHSCNTFLQLLHKPLCDAADVYRYWYVMLCCYCTVLLLHVLLRHGLPVLKLLPLYAALHAAPLMLLKCLLTLQHIAVCLMLHVTTAMQFAIAACFCYCDHIAGLCWMLLHTGK